MPPAGLVARVMGAVRRRFFTMNGARRVGGAWIILALGDAPVAALPQVLDGARFHRALWARLGAGAAAPES